MFQVQHASEGLGSEMADTQERLTLRPASPIAGHSTPLVYFVQAGEGGPIKIGWARNPWGRIRDLQVAHWAVLTMLGTTDGGVALERRLHRRFAKERVRGEWFNPSPRLYAAIARLCDDAVRAA